MPVAIEQRGDKFRVIEKGTKRLARRNDGKPVDGGGFPTERQAKTQVTAINLSEKMKGEKKPKGKKKKAAK